MHDIYDWNARLRHFPVNPKQKHMSLFNNDLFL